jgi:hypothetical protein
MDVESEVGSIGIVPGRTEKLGSLRKRRSITDASQCVKRRRATGGFMVGRGRGVNDDEAGRFEGSGPSPESVLVEG